MGYFAGLDVSLEETAICIVDGAGKEQSSAFSEIVREARAASEPEALVITTHLVETTVVLVVVMVIEGVCSAPTRSEVCSSTNSSSCTARARRVM